MSQPTESVLMNLLPYRPMATGLSRYVQRLLSAWPEQQLPLQLRVNSCGKGELSRDRTLPTLQRSGWMRTLQGMSLTQHGIPVKTLLRDRNPGCIYSPYTDYLWGLETTPQIITCHDLTPLHYPNSKRAYWHAKLWMPKHLNRATRVVAISRSVADQLINEGMPSERITVIHNGIETESNPIKIPSSHDCIVLARHSTNKNVSLAIAGFKEVLRRAPEWPGRLIVIGRNDRCTKDLHKQCRELNLDHKITWIAELSEQQLAQQLRRALCLISASLMEGFDYPLLEAQALGLPTLASDIPVHREVNGETSLLFKLDDRGQSLAHKILWLGQDRTLWTNLSKAGLCNANKHTIKHQINEVINLIEEVSR